MSPPLTHPQHPHLHTSGRGVGGGFSSGGFVGGGGGDGGGGGGDEGGGGGSFAEKMMRKMGWKEGKVRT